MGASRPNQTVISIYLTMKMNFCFSTLKRKKPPPTVVTPNAPLVPYLVSSTFSFHVGHTLISNPTGSRSVT